MAILRFSCAYLAGHEPPDVSFPSVTPGQDRDIDFSVTGIPAGDSLTSVAITGTTSAGVVVVQRVLTSSVDTHGGLTTLTGIGRGEWLYTAAETIALTAPDTLTVEVWATLASGLHFPVGQGTIALEGTNTGITPAVPATPVDGAVQTWDAAQSAYVPMLPTTAIDSTGAVDGSVPTWVASLSAYKPRIRYTRVFDPRYPSTGPGAVGNARRVNDVTVTGGSKVFTSATIALTADDVGKTIVLCDGSDNGVRLVTTLEFVDSPTQGRMAAQANISFTNRIMTIGHDDTAAFQQILQDAHAAKGGTIAVQDSGLGRYLVTAPLTIPNDGATVPRQYPIRITGSGAVDQPQVDYLAPNGIGGSQIDFNIESGTAKILTYGTGTLEIDHITLFSGGTDTVPFLMTTGTSVIVKRNLFHGNPQKQGSSCNQDCVILGGTTGTPDGTAASPFQGYVSIVEENIGVRIDRMVFGQVNANACIVAKNWASFTCGTGRSHGAPFEFNGRASAGQQRINGTVIADNQAEMNWYRHLVALDGCQGFICRDNSGFDNGGTYTLSFYYLAPGNNTFHNRIEGGWQDMVAHNVPFINADANPRNTVIYSGPGRANTGDALVAPSWMSTYFSEGLRATNLGVGLAGAGEMGATDTGGMVGGICLPDASVVPTSSLPTGGQLYTQGGVLKFRDPTGVVTSLTTIDTTPASVTVSPASQTVAHPGTQQFTAVVKNAAGGIIPGATVTWSVPVGGSFASVDSSGLATTIAAGTATIRATSGTVHGDATMTVTSGATGLLMTWPGADTASATFTADSGQSFTSYGGAGGTPSTWGRSSNKAYVSTGGTDDALLIADSGLADGTLTQVMAYSANNNVIGCGIAFRFTDASNYFMLVADGSPSNGTLTFTLYKRVAGSYTSIGTTTAITWASGDVLSVVLAGTSITVKWNGSSILSATSSFNQTATKHGLCIDTNGAIRTIRYGQLQIA